MKSNTTLGHRHGACVVMALTACVFGASGQNDTTETPPAPSRTAPTDAPAVSTPDQPKEVIRVPASAVTTGTADEVFRGRPATARRRPAGQAGAFPSSASPSKPVHRAPPSKKPAASKQPARSKPVLGTKPFADEAAARRAAAARTKASSGKGSPKNLREDLRKKGLLARESAEDTKPTDEMSRTRRGRYHRYRRSRTRASGRSTSPSEPAAQAMLDMIPDAPDESARPKSVSRTKHVAPVRVAEPPTPDSTEATVGAASAESDPAAGVPASQSAKRAGKESPKVVDEYSNFLTSESQEPSSWMVTISLLSKLALVVGLVYLTVFVLKSVLFRGGAITLKHKDVQLQVLESVALAPNRNLHVVALGGRTFLLGSTPNQVMLLAELSPGTVVNSGDGSKGFSALLSRVVPEAGAQLDSLSSQAQRDPEETLRQKVARLRQDQAVPAVSEDQGSPDG